MGKMPRVGMLMPGPAAHSAATLTPFYHGLHELGYLEGQNLARRTRARYLAANDFRSYRFEAKRPGRCLRFSHLQCGRRIATVTMIATRRRPGTRRAIAQVACSVGCLQRQASGIAARSREGFDHTDADRSPIDANTIGMADVACFAATVGAVADVTMTFTFRRTNSTNTSS
jgi:hypothetical protein